MPPAISDPISRSRGCWGSPARGRLRIVHGDTGAVVNARALPDTAGTARTTMAAERATMVARQCPRDPTR